MRAPQVGVDLAVATAPLDVALRPIEDGWHVSNDALGITGLVERGLAHGAEAVRPTPRPRSEPQAHAVSARLTRRRPLGQRRTAARRRLQTAPQRIRADLQAHIAGLERRLARTDADVAAASHASPRWRATDEIWPSTPGVGPILSRTLVAEVPEGGA